MAFDLSKIEAKLGNLSKELRGKVVNVGIPSDAQYEDGTSLAYVATIQEFGAPAVGIPPRPFFVPTIKNNRDRWVKELAAHVKQINGGQITADDALAAVGEAAVADFKAAVIKIDSPALSPITVVLREWKKGGTPNGKPITGATVGLAAKMLKEGTIQPGSDNKPLNSSGTLLAGFVSKVGKAGDDF